eukprot:356313-Chlamydomonas_euryale.AAC.3
MRGCVLRAGVESAHLVEHGDEHVGGAERVHLADHCVRRGHLHGGVGHVQRVLRRVANAVQRGAAGEEAHQAAEEAARKEVRGVGREALEHAAKDACGGRRARQRVALRADAGNLV